MEVSKTIIFKKGDCYNIHDASRLIMKLDRINPDYEFRLQAIIKRLIHHEKYSVYMRLSHYSSHGTQNLKEVALDPKIKTHATLAQASDEEIITWNIATHKYVCDCKEPRGCEVQSTPPRCIACGGPLRHRKVKDD